MLTYLNIIEVTKRVTPDRQIEVIHITMKGLRKCLKEGVISMTCKALHGDSKVLKKQEGSRGSEKAGWQF